MIGRSICMDADDVLVVSGSAAVYLEGNKVICINSLISVGDINQNGS